MTPSLPRLVARASPCLTAHSFFFRSRTRTHASGHQCARAHIEAVSRPRIWAPRRQLSGSPSAGQGQTAVGARAGMPPCCVVTQWPGRRSCHRRQRWTLSILGRVMTPGTRSWARPPARAWRARVASRACRPTDRWCPGVRLSVCHDEGSFPNRDVGFPVTVQIRRRHHRNGH